MEIFTDEDVREGIKQGKVEKFEGYAASNGQSFNPSELEGGLMDVRTQFFSSYIQTEGHFSHHYLVKESFVFT